MFICWVILSFIYILSGGGVALPAAVGIGGFVLYMLFQCLLAAGKEKKEKELNQSGFKTITVTRKIKHRNRGFLSPPDYDEEREEEIIVPIE